MKILKRTICIILIVIFLIILIVIGLFISKLESTTATISDITVNNFGEPSYFHIDILKKEYFFYNSKYILFLDYKNRKIKANELKIGDKIYILELNCAVPYMSPYQIHNILLVKKLT